MFWINENCFKNRTRQALKVSLRLRLPPNCQRAKINKYNSLFLDDKGQKRKKIKDKQIKNMLNMFLFKTCLS